MKIVMIGSGNLATQLSVALKKGGQDIVQVYSRKIEHAQCLAAKLQSIATDNIRNIVLDADVYIFSVRDDALPELINKVCIEKEHAVFIHTAGSIPMNVFEGYVLSYGVLYPMQTFSKDREVNFREIPVFIEGNNSTALQVIEELANSLSDKVVPCDSERRKYLHLAAVFACNMTNHCYRLCEQILEQHNMDFSLFLPLINETAKKVGGMSPREAQTGPMVRYDKSIMNKQLSLISNPFAKDIYMLMAKSIYDDSVKNNDV